MKVLWMSNAPWAGTGYGVQSGLLIPALREHGLDVDCFAFWGLQGNKIEYDGYTVWPELPAGEWGNEVLPSHVLHSKANMLITLVDIFVHRLQMMRELPIPWVSWVPIDCVNIGKPQLEVLKECSFPVAMSRFGEAQMMDKGVQPAATIYHAVDTDVYKPHDPDKRAANRELRGLDQDAYIVGMVMANKGNRKQFPAQLQAIRTWMNENPDRKIRIYLHTDPTSSMGGWDMKNLMEESGLKGLAFGTNQYFTNVVPQTPQQMAELYNCFDVLLNVSAGEGFGVPIVEAQACGVPVITHGVTAMPEITHYGYTVEPAAHDMANHFGWQFYPNVDDIVYRLESVYRMASQQHAKAAREWVIANCSIPVIADQWAAVIKAIDERRKEYIGERRRWIP